MLDPSAPPQASNVMLRAALDAWDAGLCVIRARIDGTKAPMGEWKQWQAVRPSRQQVAEWFSDGYPGIGVLTGRTSGGLEMLELEGRAVTEGMWDRFEAAVEAAGHGELLQRVIQGYSEHTPSDGLHLLYRCPTPRGNTKLAQRPDPSTPTGRLALIETRGEGGFVVIAPSHGPTHSSGLDWALAYGGVTTIATITDAERDALWEIARTFDEMPAPAPVAALPPRPIERTPIADGESWVTKLCHDLAREPWGSILGRYGWTHHHDAGDATYWTRPGKERRDGHSATTNAKGTDRLIVFSSSTPFEAWEGTGPAPSYDRLDVIAAYEYRGDRMAAARALAGRNTPGPRVDLHDLIANRPPANVDPATGEVTRPESAFNLPESWWDEREALWHIRQAAHSRSRSADAVLGVALARVAAQIDHTIRLPAIVGTPSPLSQAVAVIGRSGAGKSSGKDVAAELIPITSKVVVDDLPIGSGEGLIDSFFDMVTEQDPATGKNVRVKRQTRHGMFAYLDEGQALGSMGSRQGSTLLPTLRSAWSGGVLGQANASVETRRILSKGSYSMSYVVGFQLEHATALLDDAAGGTPQRFVWVWAHDETVPDSPPAWPGPLEFTRPATLMGGRYVEVCPSVTDLIVEQNRAAIRGHTEIPPLDAHANLVTLRVAALLGILDGRLTVTEDDWRLASELWRVSCAVRSLVAAHASHEARRRADARIAERARVESAIAETQETRALISGAKAIGRRAHREPGRHTRRHLRDAVAGKHRQLAEFDDMLAHALSKGWIVADGDGFRAGDSVPS